MADPVLQTQATEEAEETYNTADPVQVNKRRKKDARTRADRLKFVQASMDFEQGRAWFYDLLVRCHVFRSPFNEDPYSTAFRCGEANIGLTILSDIQDSAPDQYSLMIRENK